MRGLDNFQVEFLRRHILGSGCWADAGTIVAVKTVSGKKKENEKEREEFRNKEKRIR